MSSGKRVSLDESNSEALSKMAKSLKEKCCRVNSGALLNEVLKIFFEKYAPLSEKALERKFLDSKKYLEKVIQSSNKEEIQDLLKIVSKKVKSSLQ